MPNKPKKILRPWVKQTAPFERERRTNDFDYNGRPWRKVRAEFLQLHPLCKHCEALGLVVRATVVDHEPTAKKLIAAGLDPYDHQYLQSLCKKHHDSKSGRERHG